MNFGHHVPFDEIEDPHPDYLSLRRLVGDLRRQVARVERERDDALLEVKRLKENTSRRWRRRW